MIQRYKPRGYPLNAWLEAAIPTTKTFFGALDSDFDDESGLEWRELARFLAKNPENLPENRTT